MPAKEFLADVLRDGRIPQWWSAVDLGVPFAANPNHSALYPPMWLVAVLPMPWGADLVLVLHVLFAGIGMAALARRLGANAYGAVVAGAAFMLSGFLTSAVVHGGPLVTLAWAPWIAKSADHVARAETGRERARAAVGLAVMIAGQLLAGDPSFAITGGLLAIGLASCRADRKLVALAATTSACVAAAVLAAVAVIPALMLALESARAGGLSYDAASAWSMHPLRALEWIWPGAFGDPNQENAHLARAIADASAPLRLAPAWALSVYISIPVLSLAVLGWMHSSRRTRVLAWILLAFVLLALGRFTPLYHVYRVVFIPERMVRYPEKYLAGALVIVCALAGLGWSALGARDVARRAWTNALAGCGAMSLILGAGALALPSVVRAADTSQLAPALDVDAGVMHARGQAMVALAVTCAIIAMIWLARRRTWLRHVAAALLVGHLVAQTWSLLPTFDRDVLAHTPALLDSVDGPHRIVRPTEHRTRPTDPLAARARTLYEGAAANVATRFGHSYLVGYDQGHSARFERWQSLLESRRDRALDLYGVQLEIVAADEAAGRPVLATDAPYGPNALVANEGARPRAFVASQWRWSPNEPALREALFPARTLDEEALGLVHLRGTGSASGASAPSVTPCAIASSHPEAIDLTCETAGGGYAVLLDAWAQGWSATVDHRPAAIEQADALVRAVRIAAGRHTIRFRYTTPGLRAGLVISLLAWIAVLAALLLLGRSMPPRSGTRAPH